MEPVDAVITTAGIKLSSSNTVRTVRMFTATLKSAKSQLKPGIPMPENAPQWEEEIFDCLPKMCSCIINPSNIVTKL